MRPQTNSLSTYSGKVIIGFGKFHQERASWERACPLPRSALTLVKRAIYWPGCAGSTPKVSWTVCCWPWRKMVRVTVCPAWVLLIK
jgi:hypothetical protein